MFCFFKGLNWHYCLTIASAVQAKMWKDFHSSSHCCQSVKNSAKYLKNGRLKKSGSQEKFTAVRAPIFAKSGRKNFL